MIRRPSEQNTIYKAREERDSDDSEDEQVDGDTGSRILNLRTAWGSEFVVDASNKTAKDVDTGIREALLQIRWPGGSSVPELIADGDRYCIQLSRGEQMVYNGQQMEGMWIYKHEHIEDGAKLEVSVVPVKTAKENWGGEEEKKE